MMKTNLDMILKYEKKSYDIMKDYMIPRKILQNIDLNKLLTKTGSSKAVIMGSEILFNLKRPIDNVINIVLSSRNPEKSYLKKIYKY